MTKQTKFILAIALQAIIIFAIIIFKISVLTGGTDVLLRVGSIAPLSVLRGGYVTLQYAISNLDSSLYRGQKITNGDTIYVVLRQGGSYYFAQSVQKTKPTDGKIFIKGTVVSGGIDVQSNILQNPNFSNSRIHVVYGIEDYFIPEEKRGDFSFLISGATEEENTVMVMLDEDGNAVLKQLYLGYKPWP